MLQLAADLRFLDEPLDDLRFVLVRIEQHFDRQITAQIGIAAFQDRPHPAACNFALQLVAANPWTCLFPSRGDSDVPHRANPDQVRDPVAVAAACERLMLPAPQRQTVRLFSG
jgi:hypothetical protein